MTMASNRQMSFGLMAELYGPAVVGLLFLVVLLVFAGPVAAKFASEEWTSSGLYSAIFGWSAIQTGFAFGVYGFVLGKTGGFVGALKGTQTMDRFEGYIKRANWTGFILTFISIPLIVTEPKIAEPLTGWYIVVAAWFAFFVWAFLAFCRLAYNFGAIASVKDKEFHGA